MSSGGDKIRVLIVDDIPETRENLRKLLYFETDIDVVAAASSGQEAIEFSKEYRPDIVSAPAKRSPAKHPLPRSS